MTVLAPTQARPPLLHRVYSELTLRRLSMGEALVLWTVTLCSLGLRAALQYHRVFLGDEIGTLRYMKESPGYILTHFQTHLSMNYFILVEKGVAWLCGAADWRLTLLPLAAAGATVPLTASLALKFTGSTRTALIAASLVAFNPYLVMWGPMIRSYTLLIAFSLLAINEFLHWYGTRTWGNGARCATAVCLLLLVHLNGVYTVAFLILLLVVETIAAGWSGGRKFFWESRSLWVPLVGAGFVVGAAYWRLLPDILKLNKEWGTDTPPTSMGYIPQVFRLYMGVGYVAALSFVLLLIGSWSAAREQRALLPLYGAIMLGPVAMSLQGVSLPYSATYARYLICTLPLLLILMAEGTEWLARRVRIPGGASITALGLTTLVVLGWAPFIRTQFLAKEQFPYARVAKFLHAQMQKNDVIVAGWGMRFTLSQFFEREGERIVPPDVYVNKVSEKPDAPMASRVFYVTSPGVSKGRKTRVKYFGKIEVAIYKGQTPRALLQQWRNDLLRRTAGRIVLPLQGDYELLAVIEERLPSGQSADQWRALADRCRDLSPSAREIPRHLQTAIRAVRFP